MHKVPKEQHHLHNKMHQQTTISNNTQHQNQTIHPKAHPNILQIGLETKHYLGEHHLKQRNYQRSNFGSIALANVACGTKKSKSEGLEKEDLLTAIFEKEAHDQLCQMLYLRQENSQRLWSHDSCSERQSV